MNDSFDFSFQQFFIVVFFFSFEFMEVFERLT